MKIVTDETILRWLLDTWAGGLDWDQGNLGKLAKHKAYPGRYRLPLYGARGSGGLAWKNNAYGH